MSILNQFRPMLASPPPSSKDKIEGMTEEAIRRDFARLDWSQGYICSPKMDGIRAIVHPSQGIISRTLKPIPNRHIQEQIMKLGPLVHYFDGELVLGEADDNVDYNDNQSAIMSRDGEPTVTFNVFDSIAEHNLEFGSRIERLTEYWNTQPFENTPLRLVTHRKCVNIDQVLEYEQEQLAKGYEGIIVRHAARKYKNNRSTFLEGGMIKLKRFIDAEAEIEGFEELYRNTNEAKVDARGYTARSSHKANQIPADTLGYLKVRGINGEWEGVRFSIGSGLDDKLRDEIWNNQSKYLKRIVKYKYQAVGSKDKPRTPILLGFRSKDDLDVGMS